MGVTCTAGCSDSTAGKDVVELTYFDMGYGRADPITQLLVHANADWKFKPESMESW